MAVFRVEKNKNYTVMSNHHLRNKNLSLKAKGLLSLMLSLPEAWDYTMKGLSFICKESVDGIRTGILELEKGGYLIRRRLRNAQGQLSTVEYTILEEPQKKSDRTIEKTTLSPVAEKPTLGNPTQVKPTVEEPALDFPTQSKKEKRNTDKRNKESIHPQIGELETIEKEIVDRIDFQTLALQYSPERIREITTLIAEVVYLCGKKDHVFIGGDAFPAKRVLERFLSLDASHIEYVLECMKRIRHGIRNMRAYMLTALYNAPLTIDQYYEAEVRKDMGNGCFGKEDEE